MTLAAMLRELLEGDADLAALAPDLARLCAAQDEALEVTMELIGELRSYARESWDWKYGERWDEETEQVAAARAQAQALAERMREEAHDA